ncbi:hypothetical protein LCGC14_0363270 [marine sediment metagenome]|uniref:Uncharacterized protein n=1 Tax=marine sediment metagenome TaxID=412755 RepID=A0A0F9VUI0_9ZZZZ
MKTQTKLFSGNIILLVIVTLLSVYTIAVPDGIQVTDPNSCDSGHARFVPYTNNSGGELYCVNANSAFQWAHPFNTMQNSSHIIAAEPMSEGAIEVQMDLAESSTIWTKADELYWQYKFDGFDEEGILGIKDYNKLVWSYIWAFFVLTLEVVKLIFYLVEILFVIYVMFTLIPETFFKLRDAIVKSYIRRYAT